MGASHGEEEGRGWRRYEGGRDAVRKGRSKRGGEEERKGKIGGRGITEER